MGFNYNEQQFDQDSNKKCVDLGFSYCLPGQATCERTTTIYEDDKPKKVTLATKTCAEGKLAGVPCPYDTTLTNNCCGSEYTYKASECSYPRTISSASCNNKYKCYCDTTLYPYTTSNCASPYVLNDKCVDDSGDHYSQCACPSYYKPCDSSNNLVGIGTGCTRNGETVYEACECKAGYVQTCEQFGPTNANDYCLNGGKFYNSCKTCANNGTLDDCPTGMACTLEQCSGKWYVTGCGLNKGYISVDYNWYKCWMPIETYTKPDE